MDKWWSTELEEETQSYILKRIKGEHEGDDVGEMVIRVGMHKDRQRSDDPTYVVFESCNTTVSAVAFDDLNVRVRAARTWLMHARGNIDMLNELMETI